MTIVRRAKEGDGFKLVGRPHVYKERRDLQTMILVLGSRVRIEHTQVGEHHHYKAILKG